MHLRLRHMHACPPYTQEQCIPPFIQQTCPPYTQEQCVIPPNSQTCPSYTEDGAIARRHLITRMPPHKYDHIYQSHNHNNHHMHQYLCLLHDCVVLMFLLRFIIMVGSSIYNILHFTCYNAIHLALCEKIWIYQAFTMNTKIRGSWCCRCSKQIEMCTLMS